MNDPRVARTVYDVRSLVVKRFWPKASKGVEMAFTDP